MRPKCKYFFLVVLLAAVSGCGGQKGAKLQTSVVPPDKSLYQTGNEYLEKSQFIKARLAYQTLIRTYPGSELESEAYLAMGDSYYQEGGMENLLMAEDQYRNFIIFFPTHLRTVDAQMKIIAIIMKQMHDPDRDQSFTRRAEAEIRKMITLFPNSDYIPIVKGYLDDVQDTLARQNLGVGDFYAGRGNYFGAASRYKEIEDLYPNFSRMDEAYFKYAQSAQKTENTDEAAKYLARIVSGYPFSKYFELAKAELKKMEKPIPAVDTQLAAQHQALVKAPVPFSPLKPLIDFAMAIGFKGPPDRYEEARRIVAANKAEATAAAETLKSGQGGKPGEILITGTIERGPDGKPIAGSNSKGTPPATDKKDEKKQDDKTTKKKK